MHAIGRVEATRRAKGRPAVGPRDLILDLVIPAVAALAVLVIAWGLAALLRTRAGSKSAAAVKVPTWAAPIALAAGFCCQYPTITGALPSPLPIRTPQILFYLALAAGAVGVCEAVLRPPVLLRLVLAAIVIAASLGLVLFNRLKNPDAVAVTLLAIGVMTIVATVWWLSFEFLLFESERWVVVSAMTILAVAAGALLTMSHSLTYGRIGVALAGASIPFVLLCAVRGLGLVGTPIVFVATASSLLAAGHFYSDLSGLNLILAGSAPLLLASAWLCGAARLKPGWRIAISLLILCLPLLLAIGMSVPSFMRTLNYGAGEYGY
jgi:hypothetical protein